MPRRDIIRLLGLGLAGLLTAVLVAACGGAADSPATATTASPTSTPTLAPAPTSPPTVPATPTPADQPQPALISMESTGREIAAAFFNEEEVSCLRSSMGDDAFEAMMDAHVFLEERTLDQPALVTCLERETATDLYLMGVSLVAGGLSQDGLDCLRTRIAASDVELFAENTDIALAVVFLSCLSEEELSMLQPDPGMEPSEGEVIELDPLETFRQMAEYDDDVRAMVDCLDANATPEELDAYFAGTTEVLPEAAFECFSLVELEPDQ